MQEKEGVLDNFKGKQLRKRIFFFTAIGIIAVVLVALIVFSIIYFTRDNISPQNLTGNQTDIVNYTYNNLPTPDVTGINQTTPITNKTQKKTLAPSGGGGGGGGGGGDERCTSKSCAELGFACGNNTDNCGNAISCNNCSLGFLCQNNLCINASCSVTNTTYNFSCYNGEVYWRDNCGSLQNLKEDCVNGCFNGACSIAVCGEGICGTGENCSQDNISCSDNMCYEPTCTNGCGQTAVAARANDEGCLSPNFCNGNGNCVECINNADCGANESCVLGVCIRNTQGCDTFGSFYFDDFNDEDCISTTNDIAISGSNVYPIFSATGDGPDDDFEAYLSFENFYEDYSVGNYYYNLTLNNVNDLDNGIVTNARIIEGKYGNAFYLNKSSVYIPTNLFTQRLIKTGYTYSFWIKPERLDTEWRVDQNVSRRMLSSIYNSAIDIQNKKIRLYHSWMNGTYDSSKQASVDGNTTLIEGQWSHVAAVYDPYSQDIRVYLNGNLEATKTRVLSYAGNDYTKIGINFGNYETQYWSDRAYYTGGVDDFKFYSRPLSSEEVRNIYEKKYVSGSFISGEINLNGSYNTLYMNMGEKNPGTSHVYVLQNNQWHRILPNQDIIFDMPWRMPLTKLMYRIVFAGNTSIENITFQWSNKQYYSSSNKFSFLFLADDQLLDRANYMIKYAYQNFDDLDFIVSVPDDGGWSNGRSRVYDYYRSEWIRNPKSYFGVLPILFGNGNHDVEVPGAMELTIYRIGLEFPLIVPGMRNFKEGPYDIYTMHDNAQDRYLQYSFDYKNSHFIVMNDYFHDTLICNDSCDRFLRGNYTPRGCSSNDMLSWLESELNTTNATFKFIFHHMPLYPSDNRASYSATTLGGCLPDSRSRFMTLLARYNVTAIFVGHTHMPEFTLVNDPTGQYGSFYEISPGASWGNAAGAVVSIDENTATIRRYSSNESVSDLNNYILISEPLVITGINEAGGIGGTSIQSETSPTELPSQPSLSFISQIYSWLKGILTGNTIKAITGHFMMIKS